MNFNRFDLNLLRTLDVLLAERNVTHAAARLFVTQQAASGALSRLRAFFDDDLLVRVGRDFELTPLARSLMTPVRDALLNVEAALLSRPKFEPSTEQRRIRIAMSDYASMVVLPRFMALMAVKAPRVDVWVEAINSSSFQKLDHGDIDFCITVSEWGFGKENGVNAGTKMELLFEDDFVCVVDHARFPRGELTLDAYRAAQHNVAQFGRGTVTLVEQAWSQLGFVSNVAATSPNFSTMIFMLPGTRLVATAQRRLAITLAKPLQLGILECPVPIGSLKEKMMWHPRSEDDPAHQYFRSLFREAATELVSSHK